MLRSPVEWSCMNRILIIEATGNVGCQVLCQLAATGAQAGAVTPNAHAACLPPQVEVVRGDLTLPETFDGCLDGVDTVFLVWAAPPATSHVTAHLLAIVKLEAATRRPTAAPEVTQSSPSGWQHD